MHFFVPKAAQDQDQDNVCVVCLMEIKLISARVLLIYHSPSWNLFGSVFCTRFPIREPLGYFSTNLPVQKRLLKRQSFPDYLIAYNTAPASRVASRICIWTHTLTHNCSSKTPDLVHAGKVTRRDTTCSVYRCVCRKSPFASFSITHKTFGTQIGLRCFVSRVDVQKRGNCHWSDSIEEEGKKSAQNSNAYF